MKIEWFVVMNIDVVRKQNVKEITTNTIDQWAQLITQVIWIKCDASFIYFTRTKNDLKKLHNIIKNTDFTSKFIQSTHTDTKRVIGLMNLIE